MGPGPPQGAGMALERAETARTRTEGAGGL